MINFSIKDVIDILLFAFVMYYIYRFVKRSSAANIFSGILIFIIAWIVIAQIFSLRLMGTILDYIVNIGALALVILFQEEIRQFLSTIGTNNHNRFLRRIFSSHRQQDNKRSHEDIMPIVFACLNMSKRREGALIIIERGISLNEYVSTGETIDANVSQRLIENIFFKNSPLHDGALILRGQRLTAAGCILPVSHSTDLPKQFGLRHRAALGISQKTDALALVVSEETGNISAAIDGQIHTPLNADQLESLLSGEA